MLYAKINVKSNHFLFLTSLESPLNKGDSEGVWKYRWLHETAMKSATDFAKQATQKFTETTEFKEALAYVETMVSKGGKPVPADENGLDALVEMKYAL